MSDKYSDFLPRFGRNRGRRDDVGPERFDHFVRDARIRQQQPAPRPGIKIIVMVIVLLALGWSLKEEKTLKSVFTSRKTRVRTVVPLAVSVAERPVFSPELIDELKAEVAPPARECIQAWPEAQRDVDGKIDVEVVLGTGGAREAAIYGQVGLPDTVGRCVGEALGSVSWPEPPWERKLRFPVVGGVLRQ